MVLRGYARTPMSSFRRLAMASWRPADDPTIYGTLEVEFSRQLKHLEELRRASGTRVTVTHVVGKAVAMALKDNPRCNGKVIWGRLYTKEHPDIFFQVAVEGGKDLSGTKVESTDEKDLVTIARELESKVKSIRTGEDAQYQKGQRMMSRLPRVVMRRLLRLTLFLQYNLGWNPKFLGAPLDPFGTAMVTSVGSFGIERAYAPLYPPSRVPIVILVGEVRVRPWVVDEAAGRIEARPVLPIHATLDHRIIDGFQAAQLLRAARRYLEELGSPEGPRPAPGDARREGPPATVDTAPAAAPSPSPSA